jgi:HSP20 family protein
MIPSPSNGNSFPVDVYGDDASYFLVAELPGITKEDVELKLENAVLTIDAKRKKGEGENARVFSVTRSITVGDDINPDEVIAKMENGILTVTLPKVEERKPKSIAIS